MIIIQRQRGLIVIINLLQYFALVVIYFSCRGTRESKQSENHRARQGPVEIPYWQRGYVRALVFVFCFCLVFLFGFFLVIIIIVCVF